jgi:hypothetical protein
LDLLASRLQSWQEERNKMWLFTETGFLSAVVENPNQSKTRLAVRARDKVSLQALAEFAGADIVEIPNRDYEYRVYVEKETLIDWTSRSISEMGYGNYKSRMYQTRGADFAHTLSDVWSAMLSVSDKRPKKTQYAGYDDNWYDERHISSAKASRSKKR